MNIVVERRLFENETTIGFLYIDGVFECYTLEDKIREIKGMPIEQWKIAGKTAIPRGRYKIVVDFSSRFRRMMPHILDVPGFTGVRIHSGNTNADTEGCPLVGKSIVSSTFISESILAFDALFAKINQAIGNNEDVYINIS